MSVKSHQKQLKDDIIVCRQLERIMKAMIAFDKTCHAITEYEDGIEIEAFRVRLIHIQNKYKMK